MCLTINNVQHTTNVVSRGTNLEHGEDKKMGSDNQRAFNRVGKDTVYLRIQDMVLDALDRGIVPWKKPYHIANPHYNGVSSHVFSGNFNPMILEYFQQIREYKSNVWMTYKQASSIGGKVMTTAEQIAQLGELANAGSYNGTDCSVSLYIPVFRMREVQDEKGKTREEQSGIIGYSFYKVFNLDTITFKDEKDRKKVKDLDKAFKESKKLYPKSVEETLKVAIHNTVEKRFKFSTTVKSPRYIPHKDEVVIQPVKQFLTVGEYYNACFHELAHSTGHEDRLNRNLEGGKSSKEYAEEELIAEICASAVLARFGIKDEELEKNNTAYISGWAKQISKKDLSIAQAISRAKASENWLYFKQPTIKIEPANSTK